VQREVRDHLTLSLITAEIEDQFLITSSLVKVLASEEAAGAASPAGPAIPLVGDLEHLLEPTDQGTDSQTHIDGSSLSSRLGQP